MAQPARILYEYDTMRYDYLLFATYTTTTTTTATATVIIIYAIYARISLQIKDQNNTKIVVCMSPTRCHTHTEYAEYHEMDIMSTQIPIYFALFILYAQTRFFFVAEIMSIISIRKSCGLQSCGAMAKGDANAYFISSTNPIIEYQKNVITFSADIFWSMCLGLHIGHTQ